MAIASADQSSPPARETGSNPHIRIPVSWLVTALACLCVSFLTTLVVVATVQGTDTLSTVALALAVLAFVAQLVLTMSQMMTSEQQYHQTASINAQTLEALAEIRIATGKSLERRDQQFSRLLETVVPSALARSFAEQPDVPSSLDLNEVSRRLVEAARTELDRDVRTFGAENPVSSSRRSEVDALLAGRPRSAEFLRSFSPREQLALWRTIATSVGELSQFSDDELMNWLRDSVGEAAESANA